MGHVPSGRPPAAAHHLQSPAPTSIPSSSPPMPGRHVARATPSLTSASRRTYVTAVLQHHRLGQIEQHDHQAFRVRGSGPKLPLPPTLDPVIAAQTWRWQQQKARPDALKLTPFQNKLRANPYGNHLLLESVSACIILCPVSLTSSLC